MSFKGKVVLVTGASSGIGAAICLKFSMKSASVVLVGRKETKLQEVALRCKLSNGDPLVIAADLTIDEEVKGVFSTLMKHFGRLDVVVNNAGVAKAVSILSNEAITTFDDVMKINLRAAVLVTHFAAPHLIKTKGKIINISSIGSTSVCFRVNSQYSTSKAGLDQFTKCVALELAPYEVRVNSINPGPVKTNFMDDSGLTEEHQNKVWDVLLKGTLLDRIIEPNEVADLAVYLASDKAKCITGSSFVIDSGVLLKGIFEG